jgi:rSAM/selenodomain-associated transferase 1
MRPQVGNNLGMRMYHALSITLSQAEFALLIGCDCPALDSAYLTRACDLLAGDVSLVLGPAEDGGYVLIGARRAARRLFEGIEWGTHRVLDQTRARLRSLGWRWGELEAMWDIDRPADLARLATGDFGLAGVLTRQPTLASRCRSEDKKVPP